MVEINVEKLPKIGNSSTVILPAAVVNSLIETVNLYINNVNLLIEQTRTLELQVSELKTQVGVLAKATEEIYEAT